MTETIKKWEFVPEDTIFHTGLKLTRIRALVDYPNGHAKAGELGGYIEKSENLLDWGWVGDNAKVYDDARVSVDGLVYGNGQVYDNARVFRDGLVYDNARVYGDASVHDNGRVYGNARVYDRGRIRDSGRVFHLSEVCGDGVVSNYACIASNGYVSDAKDVIIFNNVGTENETLTAHRQKDGSVNLVRGCFSGDIDKFLTASAETHRNMFDIKREYELIIEVIKHRFKVS